ncbi:Cytochrome P450 CYP4, partial [Frankliniella occidentalis]
QAVLSSVHHIDKSPDYSTLHPWLRFGLLTSTGAKWHARRRLLTPTFHFRILDQFLPVFNRNTAVLVKKLEKEAGREAFNLGHYVHLCALDTICESAMGTTVHAQEDSNSEYVQAVKTACCKAYMRLVKPWLYPDATFYATPYGWSFSRALKVLHGLTTSVIQKRKGIHTEELLKIQQPAEDGTKLRVAFLDQLLLANQNGAGLSDMDIQEEVDTFMFEGHDTTGTAITFTLYALSVNPKVQEMAYQEITSVMGDKTRDITNQDLAQMKYLERVIKEGLRLYPSVPVFLRSLKRDLPLEMDGKHVVPAGTTVVVCPYVLHRTESLWPDPERFDPDRFLPENSVDRHAFAYVPFSAGPRNCIGQKYAMMEMKCMIARLLMEFRFLEAYPGYKPKIAGELILKSRDDKLLVRVQKRD